MKRRTQKRLINNLCGELFAECVVLSHICQKQEETDKIMVEVLKGQDDFISRLSHVEPGKTKEFFKNFHTDLTLFTQKVEQLMQAL